MGRMVDGELRRPKKISDTVQRRRERWGGKPTHLSSLQIGLGARGSNYAWKLGVMIEAGERKKPSGNPEKSAGGGERGEKKCSWSLPGIDQGSKQENQ